MWSPAIAAAQHMAAEGGQSRPGCARRRGRVARQEFDDCTAEFGEGGGGGEREGGEGAALRSSLRSRDAVPAAATTSSPAAAHSLEMARATGEQMVFASASTTNSPAASPDMPCTAPGPFPHFETILYDNAILCASSTEIWRPDR